MALRTPAPCASREKTARGAPDSSSLSPSKVATPLTMRAVRLPTSSTVLTLTPSSGGGWTTTRLTRPESVGTCSPSTSTACTTGDHGSTALAWRGGSMAAAPPAVLAPPAAPKASAAKARRTGTPGERALKVRLVRAGCSIEAKFDGRTTASSERPSPPLSTAASASGVTRGRSRASPPGRPRHATAEPRWCGAPGAHAGSPPLPPRRHTCTRVVGVLTRSPRGSTMWTTTSEGSGASSCTTSATTAYPSSSVPATDSAALRPSPAAPSAAPSAVAGRAKASFTAVPRPTISKASLCALSSGQPPLTALARRRAMQRPPSAIAAHAPSATPRPASSPRAWKEAMPKTLGA